MTDATDLPLAVYGTLRPGGRAYVAFDLAQRTRHLGPCRIPGRIVDLGGYPGLIATTEPQQAGEGVAADLLVILDPALIDELDVYEGPDYQRATVQLLEPDRAALVWLWRHDAADAAPVPGNDWTQRVSQEIDPADDPLSRENSQAHR